MPVAVGPYGQTQPSCFDRVKMGFMMGFAVGMAAGAMFGTFSCLRIGMRGRELMGGVGKTMMQSGGTFGTFMAIGMGIRCWGRRGTTSSASSRLYTHGTFPITATTILCPLDAVTLSTCSLVLSIKSSDLSNGFQSECVILSDAADVLLWRKNSTCR